MSLVGLIKRSSMVGNLSAERPLIGRTGLAPSRIGFMVETSSVDDSGFARPPLRFALVVG